METPIKIVVCSSGYGSWNTAFVPTELEAIGYESNKYQAIVSALEQAGLIQVIDVEEARQKRMEAKRTARVETARVEVDETQPIPALAGPCEPL